MTDTWDAAGFVASSRYRLAVCEYLADDGPGLPSGIATETGLAQPHVSRALSELRDRDIVELLVPESQQKGRLYDLTRSGRIALDRMQNGRDAVDVEVVGRDQFPHGALLDYIERSHPTVTQAVAVYDGDVVSIHFLGEQSPEAETSAIAQLYATSTPTDRLTSGSTGRHEFTVYGLEKLTLVDLTFVDDRRIGVSLDDEADLAVRSFVEEIEVVLRN
jgi:DNA-binding MarR family transcriptional regulator